MDIKKIAVIGSGISGLACAHRLIELKEEEGVPLEVLLFDSASRVGGSIQSENKDGFLLESGADSFISEKPAVIDLCRRLGIESEIIQTQEANRKIYVVKNRKLIPLPTGFSLVAPLDPVAFLKSPLFSLPAKFRMMFERFLPARSFIKEESVSHFIRRRFGKEALDRVGQPMVAGIYAGDPNQLSIRATMPRLLELESKYGSVTKGLLLESKIRKEKLSNTSGPRYSLFLSFKNGMETLPRAIAAHFPLGTLQLNTEIQEITYEASRKKWQLLASNGQRRTVDTICVASSGLAAGKLLKNNFLELSEKLKSFVTEPVATLNFGWRRQAISHTLDSFGFVVPQIEHSPLMACTFASQKFAHRAAEGMVLLRAFVGGAFGKEFFEKDDQNLIEIAELELERLLGIKEKPIVRSLRRYPNSMIQYRVGYQDLHAAVQRELKNLSGLFLAGPYQGVGVPDCIAEAENQADRIVQYFINNN